MLDISYNKIEYLVPISDKCFRFENLYVNMFANRINFKNETNISFIKNNLPSTTTNAKVIIGIQGISSEREYLISYTKDITTSNDTYAKFYLIRI